nr:MAG TPA: hypothetical protein [Bacteriophage sp.]
MFSKLFLPTGKVELRKAVFLLCYLLFAQILSKLAR